MVKTPDEGIREGSYRVLTKGLLILVQGVLTMAPVGSVPNVAGQTKRSGLEGCPEALWTPPSRQASNPRHWNLVAKVQTSGTRHR